MPKRSKLVPLVTVLMLSACPLGADEPPAGAPAPIGAELMRSEGAWSECSGGLHLYREGRQLQSQCFGPDAVFVFELQASLTPEAAATLDAALASADLDDTEPVDHQGLCGSPDAVAVETLWVQGRSVSFAQHCPPAGIVSLYEHVDALLTELALCGEGPSQLLASTDSPCPQ